MGGTMSEVYKWDNFIEFKTREVQAPGIHLQTLGLLF